jgi:hypothetical protein
MEVENVSIEINGSTFTWILHVLEVGGTSDLCVLFEVREECFLDASQVYNQRYAISYGYNYS